MVPAFFTPRRQRSYCPGMELLEDRCVPAVGLNTFARFTAESVADPSAITIQVAADTFTLPRGRVGIALNLRASNDNAIDPAPVTVQTLTGLPANTLHVRENRAGETTSLTLVSFAKGSASIALPSSLLNGGWTLDASLIGDADGNFRVDSADLRLVNGLVGKQRGQAGFLRQADFDGDGAISVADANLVRTFAGASTSVRPLGLVAGLAAASDPDGNKIVLKPQIIVSGQTRPGAVVRLDVGADGSIEKQTKANATGRFQFSLTIAPGTSALRVLSTDRLGQRITTDTEVTLGDVVLDWNAVHLTAVRDYTVFSQVPYSNRIVFTAPPLAARNLAIMHAAMHDAIVSAQGSGTPYHVGLAAPAGTSAIAAAASAANRILVALHPKAEQIALFNAALAEALAAVPAGTHKSAGITLGRQIADAYLAWRGTDGARTVRPYTPGTDVGAWRFTPPDFLPALIPHWPDVAPFVIPSGDAFRPPAPPDLASEEYATAFNRVKELGRFDSATRTAEETEIALFWSDGPGTFTPAGHWNQIAATVALQAGHTLAQNAELFAVLNLALADAGIACWDAKYAYNFWRPITAIREADGDGNDLTAADPTWAPLLKTPNFPSYTSGHSTFSAAAATVLTAYFGDNRSFTSESDGHEGFTERPLARTITRTFTGFLQAAAEATASREFGGIHFLFDDTVGFDAGLAIGAYVLANWREGST